MARDIDGVIEELRTQFSNLRFNSKSLEAFLRNYVADDSIDSWHFTSTDSVVELVLVSPNSVHLISAPRTSSQAVDSASVGLRSIGLIHIDKDEQRVKVTLEVGGVGSIEFGGPLSDQTIFPLARRIARLAWVQ